MWRQCSPTSIVRDALRGALAVGCDDLMTCVTSDDCPLSLDGLAG
jgi:hypothetical protein